MTWRVLPCYHKSLDKDLFIGGSFSSESPAPGGQVTPFKIRLDRVTSLN